MEPQVDCTPSLRHGYLVTRRFHLQQQSRDDERSAHAALLGLRHDILDGAIGHGGGMIRRMKASNSGTVNAVSPCAGL
jgi:hypothetical protein